MKKRHKAEMTEFYILKCQFCYDAQNLLLKHIKILGFFQATEQEMQKFLKGK